MLVTSSFLNQLLTLLLVGVCISFISCDNPTELEGPVPNPHDSLRVLHISPDGHASQYSGTITYTHGQLVDGEYSVGLSVVAETIVLSPTIHVSEDLTIQTGQSGAFTISIDRAPQEMTRVIYSWESADILITPAHPVDFSAEDIAPQVLTVTHVGDGPTTASITFKVFTEDETGGRESITMIKRQINVTDDHAVPEVSVSGALQLHPGEKGYVTISIDKAPDAEVVRVILAPPDSDSLKVDPQRVFSFTHSNWRPRVLTVDHLGVVKGESSSLGIEAKGGVALSIHLVLKQEAHQATLTGLEVVAGEQIAFEATGFVHANGRFQAVGRDFTSPFTDTCGIKSTKDSRLRFQKNGLTITQSFDTDICPSLEVTADLVMLE